MELSGSLPKQAAEALYEEHRHRGDFDELIAFITSGTVHLFVFDGDEAVEVGKIIVGKGEHSQGLRQAWYTGGYANAAHCPDCPADAAREIRLVSDGLAQGTVD